MGEGPDRLEAWRLLRAVVTDRLDEYRRAVVEATGLPFSRARALRRLLPGPLTHGALAEKMMVDRPAASVAVDDLCARGLTRRVPHPTDRRSKLVELTEEGRRVALLVEAVVPPPPPGWADVPAADLAAVVRVARIVRDA
jgi:DNA-binding MarR family transcriptional regulator